MPLYCSFKGLFFGSRIVVSVNSLEHAFTPILPYTSYLNVRQARFFLIRKTRYSFLKTFCYAVL